MLDGNIFTLYADVLVIIFTRLNELSKLIIIK